MVDWNELSKTYSAWHVLESPSNHHKRYFNKHVFLIPGNSNTIESWLKTIFFDYIT